MNNMNNNSDSQTKSNSYIAIRNNGYMHKFRKSPQESDESATLRAWYIIKELPENMSQLEKECRSHMWLNVKYFGMIYRYDESN